MPVLSLAPRRQPCIAAQPTLDCKLLPIRPTTPVLHPQGSVVRATEPVVTTAEAGATSNPLRARSERPSNEVIGGAFIGAFLGFLIIIGLIQCCRNRRRNNGGEKASSTYSPPSSPRYPPPHGPPRPPMYNGPGPGPLPPLPPFHETSAPAGPFPPPPRPARTQSMHQRTNVFIAAVDGRPGVAVKRAGSPRRPGRHRRAELGSESSSSSDRRRRRRVCLSPLSLVFEIHHRAFFSSFGLLSFTIVEFEAWRWRRDL